MIKDIPGLVSAVSADIKNACDVAVVGMSGGADSTLVALLCKEALGANDVYSVHMPYNDRDNGFFNDRSLKTATRLGVHILKAPIKGIADAINETVTVALVDNNLVRGKEFPTSDGQTATLFAISHVNAGNSRSRSRMNVLYGVSHHLSDHLGVRARVVGTGNLSEDYIGYDTKGGDALCDFFPVGQLFKSEVYQLLDWFRDRGDIEESMIDRVPSAGLWDGQSDEDELGCSYNLMEPSIRVLGLGQTEHIIEADAEITNFVRERHQANKHKHEAPPVFDIRKWCD